MASRISISNLKAAIEVGNGPTLASQYEALIFFPPALQAANDGFTPQNMSILCQSVSIAGVQLATTELPVYGPPVKMPYGLVFQDLNISFLCTNSMAQRRIFDEWRRIIVDPTTNFVNYYDTYIGQIFLYKLDQSGNKVHGLTYEEVFPLAIYEQELSANNNDWLRLNVSLSYRRMRTGADLRAADRIGGGNTLPPSPGQTENPDDVFKNTPAPKVPEFKP